MDGTMGGLTAFFSRMTSMAAMLLAFFVLAGAGAARADNATYSMQEIVDAGHGFFGETTGGFAKVLETAFS
eukprot:gene65385-89438_t